MLLVGVDEIPERLQGYNWGKVKRPSFPIDGGIVRELMGDMDLEIDPKLLAALGEIKKKQDAIRAIGSMANVEGDPRLFPDQRVGVRWLLALGRGILADEQGMGKTVVTLVAAQEYSQNHYLVICNRSKMKDWSDHISHWLGAKVVELVGNAKQREKILDSWTGWLISNYTTSVICAKQLSKAEVVIYDEAHHLANRRSTFFKAAKVITRGSVRVFVATASPIVNSPSDVWPLLHLCDPKRFSSYWGFVFRFCMVDKGNFGFKVWGIREDTKEELDGLLSCYVLRRDKSLRQGLPPKRKYVVDFHMSSRHRVIYDSMEEQGFVALGSKEVSADVKVAQITRLRQLAISPQLLFPDYDGCDKIDELIDLCIGLPGQFVIFTAFAQAALLCQERFLDYGIPISLLTGSMNSKEQKESLLHFQQGWYRGMVATHKTGGEGLNLVQAQHAIFLDLAWHPAGNQHAEDRIHRTGQTAPYVEIFILKTADSIEDHVWAIISNKQQVTVDRLLRRMKGD